MVIKASIIDCEREHSQCSSVCVCVCCMRKNGSVASSHVTCATIVCILFSITFVFIFVFGVFNYLAVVK